MVLAYDGLIVTDVLCMRFYEWLYINFADDSVYKTVIAFVILIPRQ